MDKDSRQGKAGQGPGACSATSGGRKPVAPSGVFTRRWPMPSRSVKSFSLLLIVRGYLSCSPTRSAALEFSGSMAPGASASCCSVSEGKTR